MHSRIRSFVECGHRASKHVYGHNIDQWYKGDDMKMSCYILEKSYIFEMQ